MNFNCPYFYYSHDKSPHALYQLKTWTSPPQFQDYNSFSAVLHFYNSDNNLEMLTRTDRSGAYLFDESYGQEILLLLLDTQVFSLCLLCIHHGDQLIRKVRPAYRDMRFIIRNTST
ncbi:hypothetical protein H5410_028295, partial [Solanum commersonii]